MKSWQDSLFCLNSLLNTAVIEVFLFDSGYFCNPSKCLRSIKTLLFFEALSVYI